MTSLRSRRVWLLGAMTALLLFAVWLRMRYLVSFVEWPDEIRTLWRTQGSFDHFLARNPPDWPATYGALMWAWVRVAGSALEVSRFVSVMAAALGVALTFRAARALMALVGSRHRDATALLAATVFAVLGYAIFAGVDVRAYGLLLALGPLAVWMALRWLRQPSLKRSVLAALALAALVYVSYTSVTLIAFISLFVLIVRPRRFLRWIPVGVGAVVLALPLAAGFFANAAGRVGGVMPQPVPPFPEAMAGVYSDFGGSAVFLPLLGAAVVLIVLLSVRFTAVRRPALVLVLWVLLPVAVYFIVNNNEFLKPRYLWPVVASLTLLISLAFARLPRAASWVATAAFIAFAIAPVDYQAYRLAETTAPPFRSVFSWLAEHLRPGDVLVIDPNCTCGEPYGWDVFVPQFFPTGYLPIVDDPGAAPRVWYLSNTGWKHDEALLAKVENGRKAEEFVGPWFFLLRLYEGPPLRNGIDFGDKVIFNGADIAGNDTILAQDDTVNVRLWWSAAQKLDKDYSISVAILDHRGKVVAQADGPARGDGTPEQMSTWEPGTFYRDERSLQLPATVEDGDYKLVITVYQWWDGVRLTPGAHPGFDATSDNYLVVRRLKVTA